jgi:hypothetical protein
MHQIFSSKKIANKLIRRCVPHDIDPPLHSKRSDSERISRSNVNELIRRRVPRSDDVLSDD